MFKKTNNHSFDALDMGLESYLNYEQNISKGIRTACL
jgi:hypothetical protein